MLCFTNPALKTLINFRDYRIDAKGYGVARIGGSVQIEYTKCLMYPFSRTEEKHMS